MHDDGVPHNLPVALSIILFGFPTNNSKYNRESEIQTCNCCTQAALLLLGWRECESVVSRSLAQRTVAIFKTEKVVISLLKIAATSGADVCTMVCHQM